MHEENGSIVIPLLTEDASVAKRQQTTGRLKVSTVTRRHEQLVEELLACESVEIDRVPVGRVVERTPQMRQEGDTLIIPVMEEVLVLERRLILKEEVRVRRVRTARKHKERVQLRRQEAVITRDAGQTTEGAARNYAAGTETHNAKKE